MKSHLTACLALLTLSLGCRPAQSTPAPPSMPAKPSSAIVAQAEAAEAIKQHLGYNEVLAYEFQGIWLECWLECEVDGEVAASTPRATCSPREFLEKGKAPQDPEHIRGWLTIWGQEHDLMHLTMRSQWYRPESDTTSYAWQPSHELMIPSGEPQVRFQTGVPADAGWTQPVVLPEIGQEFVIQSWHWDEQATADGPIQRSMKISLKGRQLSGEE